MSQFNFEAIGTGWHIDIEETLSPQTENEILFNINKLIDEFDKIYSRFRKDSLVTEISTKVGEYVFPTDGEELFATYKKFYDITNGLLTPLIGNVMADAGYDAEYSLKQKKELEQPLKWDNVISYKHPVLNVRQPVLLDFGAAGKGYLIDLVGRLILQRDINSFCIDAGGDILYKNIEQKPLRIGLENPENINEVIGVVEISNQSLCGSACNRRAWQNFHHIISPESLVSPRHILATWAVAKTTILADALATSLFFVDAEKLLQHENFDYLILYADHSVEKSAGFSADLFTVGE